MKKQEDKLDYGEIGIIILILVAIIGFVISLLKWGGTI